MNVKRKQKGFSVVVLATIIIVSTFVSMHVLNTNAQLNQTINIDGNLMAKLSPQTRNLLWMGEGLGLVSHSGPYWFAGNVGQSKIILGFNYSDPSNPFGVCDIQFIDAGGNRPFPYMNMFDGAFPRLYLNQIGDITVHFDIKLNDFTYDSNTALRMAVVVVLDNGTSKIYFEQDIQDSPLSAAGLPYVGSNVVEIHLQTIENGTWVHLDVDFEKMLQTYSTFQFAKSFFVFSNSSFVASCYLVNECYGTGNVSYDIKNFWITVEKSE